MFTAMIWLLRILLFLLGTIFGYILAFISICTKPTRYDVREAYDQGYERGYSDAEFEFICEDLDEIEENEDE